MFIDGTKLESKANRYTFVWRKTVERELKKLKTSLKPKLKDELSESEYLTLKKAKERLRELYKEIEEAHIEVKRGKGYHKPATLLLHDEIRQLVERWKAYEENKRLLGEGRNSYSKTDPDATFMHIKEDHMRNGQLRPEYIRVLQLS